MATSSILKQVNIKDKRAGRTFVNALAESKRKKGMKVKMSKPYREITGDSIKELFK